MTVTVTSVVTVTVTGNGHVAADSMGPPGLMDVSGGLTPVPVPVG